MIQVSVKKSESGNIIGFHVIGHSGYSESGTDIVCASVSALVFNCINSMEKFSETKFDLHQNESEGMIDLKCVNNLDEAAILLLKSLFLGIRGIQDAYGEQYVILQD